MESSRQVSSAARSAGPPRRSRYTPEQLRIMRDRLQTTIENIQGILISADLPRAELDTLWAARRVLVRLDDRLRAGERRHGEFARPRVREEYEITPAGRAALLESQQAGAR